MNIDWKKVKKIPGWWRWVPFLQIDVAATVYPYMYFPKDVFDDLRSDSPDKNNFSILVHERVHLERQIQYGALAWNLKYIFSKKFRLKEELEAITVQMKYMKENNLEYNIERKASQFASCLYLWVLPEDKARDVLTKLWNTKGV
jgi:hypothetical protein